MEDLTKMKVADLKKHLRSRGLLVTGNKNELVERLQESLEADGSGTIDDDEEFDEEEILNNDISTEISQEEEAAALSGSIQIKSSDLLISKPASEKKKVSLKRSEISISEVTKDEEKKGSAEATSLANKENLSSETVEPKHKIIKLSDDATNGSSNEEQKKPEEDPSKMTDDDRKKARAERFSISMSDVVSSNGTSSKNNKLSTETGGIDLDKLKKRAERFGEVTSKNLSKLEDSEKKKEREKRFGTAGANDASDGTKTEDEIALKKAKRAQRFGSSDGSAPAAAVTITTSPSDSLDAVKKTSNKVPIVAPGTTGTSTTNDAVSAKAKRAQRFGAS